MAYADIQCMLDDPPGYRNYWSAEHLRSLPDDAIETICRQAKAMISPSPSQQALFPGGGLVSRQGLDWPVPWRSTPWCVHPFGLWEKPEDDARGRQWTHDLRDALKPWASGAVYLNFIGDEGRDRIVAGFGKENYGRLAQVKRQFDPDNVFHLNQNILPA
jgi:FAD/FMN-containing dehydrogenase